MKKRTITVKMYYNRIAFESMDHFPDDGNGQAHTKAAALAWDSTATRYLSDHAGPASETDIRHGNDSDLHGPFVTVTEFDEDEGEIEVDATPEEMTEAKRIAKAADAAGWKAAGETLWNG